MDYRQAANEQKYDMAASCYDLIAFLMSLGQAKNLYAKVAEKIDVETTRTIVELGCGPASVIPYLVDRVSNDTQIIGIDFSSKMIDIADRKKARNGWMNVRFECMDMYDFSEEGYADTVIFCLALTAIPNATKALAKALSILKPRGQLIIVDSIPLHQKWWHPITNIYIYFKSLIVGAKPTDEIVPFIHAQMTHVQQEEMAYGVYTVLTANKK